MQTFSLLRPDPHLRPFRAIVLGGGAIGLVVLWFVVIATNASLSKGAIISAFIVAWSVGINFVFEKARRGTVTVGPEGIVVNRSLGTVVYPWGDVTGVRVEDVGTPPGSPRRPFDRLFGPLPAGVRVDLARSPRVGLVPGRHGTEVRGIPTGTRAIYLYVDEPTHMSSEANGFMVNA